MLRVPTVVSLLGVALLAGCIDAETGTPTETDPYVEPTYDALAEVPATITGMELLSGSEVPTGAGIWVDGDHAYVGARSQGFHVVDLSDPNGAVVVGSVAGIADVPAEEGGLYGRDVDLIKYDDGRKVAVVAGQSAGMFFIDVTDPTAPEVISVITNDQLADVPTHNVDVVPGTSYVFNAPSGGMGRTNHLVDASDPDEPIVLHGVGEHGCHDISFYMNDEEEKYRAYCAGRDITEIWDLTDMHDIRIITQLSHPVLDNGGGLHHLAMVNQDATLLVLGDEFQGGGGPGCQANTPVASTPIGALWFFDISGDKEQDPEQLSWFSPNAPATRYAEENQDYPMGLVNDPDPGNQPDTSCTSHFGSFIGDTDVLAMAWYYAGVILIDLSDPTMPEQVAQYNAGTNTWDVKFHRGVLVTGDISRGLDVLKLV